MATVIKAGQAGEAMRRLSTVDLADHLREARDVVARAESHARSLIEQAQQASVQIKESARQAGHRAGYDAGHQEGMEAGRQSAFESSTARFREAQASLIGAFKDAIDGVERMKGDLELAAREDVLRLAVTAATHLTCAIGRMYPEAATENLRRAIRLVGTQSDLTIHVAETDLECMSTFAPELLQSLGAEVHVTVKSDDRMAAGGCRVTTAKTEVDATLKTQLDQMVSLLLGESTSHE